MAYDARIILAGQQPDIVNVLARSTAAAGAANQQRQQNALNQLYQTQGANILAGDQGALNALAGINPMAALDVQNTRQTMDLRNRQEDRLSAADKRAQQVADAERQLKQFGMSTLNAPSPQDYDRLMAENGYPQFVGTYDNRQSVVAGIVDGPLAQIAEWNTAQKAKEPADEYERYVAEEKAAKRQPLTRLEFAQAKKGTEIIYGPDGNPIIQRGPATMKPFTEGQSKDNVYATRARGALDVLEPVAGALTSRGQRLAEKAPLGLGRGLQTDEFQVATQAGTEFLQAILRKDTGAAITQAETDSYGVTYLPQPGDGDAILEAKRNARIRAIAAMEAGMSPAQMLARDQALVKAARESSGGPPTSDAGRAQLESQIRNIPDFGSMTDDELDAWIAEHGE